MKHKKTTPCTITVEEAVGQAWQEWLEAKGRQPQPMADLAIWMVTQLSAARIDTLLPQMQSWLDFQRNFAEFTAAAESLKCIVSGQETTEVTKDVDVTKSSIAISSSIAEAWEAWAPRKQKEARLMASLALWTLTEIPPDPIDKALAAMKSGQSLRQAGLMSEIGVAIKNIGRSTCLNCGRLMRRDAKHDHCSLSSECRRLAAETARRWRFVRPREMMVGSKHPCWEGGEEELCCICGVSVGWRSPSKLASGGLAYCSKHRHRWREMRKLQEQLGIA